MNQTDKIEDTDIPLVLAFLNAVCQELLHKTIENAHYADKYLLEEESQRMNKVKHISKNEFVCLDRLKLMDEVKYFNRMIHRAILAWSDSEEKHCAAYELISTFSQLIDVELNRPVENPKKWRTKGVNLLQMNNRLNKNKRF